MIEDTTLYAHIDNLESLYTVFQTFEDNLLEENKTTMLVNSLAPEYENLAASNASWEKFDES